MHMSRQCQPVVSATLANGLILFLRLAHAMSRDKV